MGVGNSQVRDCIYELKGALRTIEYQLAGLDRELKFLEKKLEIHFTYAEKVEKHRFDHVYRRIDQLRGQ